jgi:hypothetical protein
MRFVMIFSSLPGYRVVTYRLGEDGSDNPPPFLVVEEHEVLAWRTTEQGLVPVGTNEIANGGLGQLIEGQYAVVLPDGSVSDNMYGCDSVEAYKHWVEADFKSGELYFDKPDDDAKYAKRCPRRAARQRCLEETMRHVRAQAKAAEAAEAF